MATSNKAKFHAFDPGIGGAEFDKTHDDIKNVKRIDETWPEDEFGAKLSLGANFGSLLETMGSGDIIMRTDGEAVDPPRSETIEVPDPGSPQFGQRARERRYGLQKKEWGTDDKGHGRGRPMHADRPMPKGPPDANGKDIDITDVVSGKKLSMKNRRRELESAGRD